MKNSIVLFVNRKVFIAFQMTLLFISSLVMTGCGNTEVDKCIEKQSYLWDNKTNNPNANKAYWSAVERCKSKGK